MPEVISLGPFMIRMDWVLLALSGGCGYIVIQWLLKRSEFRERPVLDTLLNTLFITFLIWKFSPVLFTPSLLWTHPLGLLTMSGSLIGLWLGLAVAGWYMHRSLRRMNVSWLFVGDLLSFGFPIILMVYSLLAWQYGSTTAVPWGISIQDPDYKYHPVNIYTLIVTLPMLVWLWRKRNSLGIGYMFVNTFKYYSMGLMMVTYFKSKTNSFTGLSREQWIYVLMMALGLLLSLYITGRRGKEDFSLVGENESQHDGGTGL